MYNNGEVTASRRYLFNLLSVIISLIMIFQIASIPTLVSAASTSVSSPPQTTYQESGSNANQISGNASGNVTAESSSANQTVEVVCGNTTLQATCVNGTACIQCGDETICVPCSTSNTTPDSGDTGQQPLTSDNATSPVSSDNETTPSTTDNSTPIIPSDTTTDNVTPSAPPTSDNTTPETPPTGDNATPTVPTSDNVTLPTLPSSDNATPVLPPSANATAPVLPPSANITPTVPSPGANVTTLRPLAKHNVFPVERITHVVTANVRPDQGANITSGSGKIRLNMPAAAVDEAVEVEIAEYTPSGSSAMKMLNQFELTAAAAGGYEVSQFNRNLEITIQHSPNDLIGLNPDSLRLFYLDENTRQWLPVEYSHYDKETGVLTARTSHFTNYGEQADPLAVGPGRVMAADTNLHSGAATFSYPFELPPGPGGFQPTLELVYNSGSVDEMKNRRDVGSWVGTGWSLSLGKITSNITAGKYYLDLNGASYEISENGTSGNWYTSPDQHFKITRSGDTWELRDTNGYYYKFGGDADAIQYLPSSYGGSYRWDLSVFADTDNNTATISYIQNTQGTSPNDWVRSAYPQYLRYGNNDAIEIHFISSGNRTDNPQDYSGGYSAPAIIEDRQLDAIEINVSDNLIRRYAFTYNTTSSYPSTDYGGIYYAGKHVLTSLTQVGADNVTSLPPMTFSYQDLQTYRYTVDYAYTGNPGNEAAFSWPHLTAIGSGYGGTVSFTYTQHPFPASDNSTGTWSREVVKTKTIDSGIGTTQSYYYTYTGNPEYLGTGWDQEFRGFREVKKTDADNNYSIHYYYTTGNFSGLSADNLTGIQYKTEFYSSNDTLLLRQNYDWDYCALVESGENITQLWRQWLASSTETSGDKTSQTRFSYDNYGNIVTVYQDGDLSTSDDDSTIWRAFYPNTTLNILNNPARERVYSGNATSDSGGSNLESQTLYYYDGNDTADPLTTAPSLGHLTRLNKSINSTSSIDSYFSYDNYGNTIISLSPNGDTTAWAYDGTYRTYPISKAVSSGDFLAELTDNYTAFVMIVVGIAGGTLPVNLTEMYTFDPGTNNILTKVDYNGQTTTYAYDTLKRLTSVTKPGDTSPSVMYQYNDWGTINQQHIKVLAEVSDNEVLWRKDYFDGLGRIVQSQSPSDAGHIIISGTNAFNSRGLLEKSYVAQDLPSYDVDGYQAPGTYWRYGSYTYDGLGRVTTEVNTDNSTVTHNYDVAWSDNVTNTLGYQKVYNFDAFQRLVEVAEYDDSDALYATTGYDYDARGNLIQVTDNHSNTTTMTCDWLGRKLTMTSPDTGSWSFTYDDNGNLVSQTDAKGQTVNFTYDALNRLTAKIYNDGGVTDNVNYYHDSTQNGNYGKGQRTSMTDAAGTTNYTYDARGRLIEETRIFSSDNYTTSYAYDGADRVTNIIYPTGENVTQTYDRRGLPYSLSGNASGDLVTSTLYNFLGQVTDINFGNSLKTTFGYWDTGGIYDNPGQSYSRLWEIQTYSQPASGSIQGGTLGVDATSGGAVSSSNGTYDAGVVVNISAVADSGYEFTGWSGDVTTVEDTVSANTTVTMCGNYTITANFQSTNRTLTLNSSTGGNVTVPGGESSYSHTKGDVVQLVATADNDTMFRRWTGDTAGIDDVYACITSIKIGDNATIEAQFSSPTSIMITASIRVVPDYDLTVKASTGGSVNSSSSSLFTYPAGTSVNLTAEADTGYYFVSWTGDVVSYNSTTTSVTIDGNKTVVANFVSDSAPTNLLQDVQHTWDAGGNLVSRYDAVASETESFGYDFLDRLTSVSGAYSSSYSYDEIGNIVNMNGNGYSYGSQPHAVTTVNATSYTYDDNGNMLTGDNRSITWDAENRPISMTVDGVISTFVYDGDGNRVQKTVGYGTADNVTTAYINMYYEKNLTTSVITTYYYLGDRLVASVNSTDLRYHHQDHLTGTSLMTDDGGDSLGTIKYAPYGDTRSGTVPTDIQFTGQRFDSTGLYYYGGRFYDPDIGRFISADPMIAYPGNPQAWNAYSYALNNPLKYVDPTGLFTEDELKAAGLTSDDVDEVLWQYLLTADDWDILFIATEGGDNYYFGFVDIDGILMLQDTETGEIQPLSILANDNIGDGAKEDDIKEVGLQHKTVEDDGTIVINFSRMPLGALDPPRVNWRRVGQVAGGVFLIAGGAVVTFLGGVGVVVGFVGMCTGLAFVPSAALVVIGGFEVYSGIGFIGSGVSMFTGGKRGWDTPYIGN